MIGDFLKKFRSSNYSGKSTEDKSSPEKPGAEQDEKPSTPRMIALTDDEMQAFQGSQPGAQVSCTVTGSMEKDGKLHVMSVSPADKAAGYGSEQEMAGAVAQRVTPSVQLSPS